MQIQLPVEWAYYWIDVTFQTIHFKKQLKRQQEILVLKQLWGNALITDTYTTKLADLPTLAGDQQNNFINLQQERKNYE